MPVAHFYSRSLFGVLGFDVPKQLVHLGEFVGSRSPNILDANARFYLVHCENIATRLADVCYFQLSIEGLLAAKDHKYKLSLLVRTNLVAYLGAVKSYLDAIATCIDAIYGLALKRMNLDLCRDQLHVKLGEIDPEASANYAAHSEFYNRVGLWRNAALHEVSPLVMECGPSWARPGSPAYGQYGDHSEVRMVNIPGFSPGDMASAPATAIWVKPNSFFAAWNQSIDQLLTLICNDIMKHCPAA
ncbi:hypothetical protein [Paraburkholderia fungorum]|uniref:hypothetical protein n=1 Tax=Paraburkholderia fungorum TaxID=134537 RepID=UPI000C9AC015|nr:hypothetical protein [Paraburkholderia fungorum]MBB5542825.1 hypothetical protein [Paraburkholderia fungorum]